MSGIAINLKPQPVWFCADDELFDATELAMSYSKEERACLKFLIRPALRDVVQQTLEKHTERKRTARFVQGRREFVDEDKVDQAGFVDDMTDHLIMDWDGLIDEDSGQQLPCNRENKLALANSYPRLGAAFLEASNWVAARARADRSSVEKN